MKNKEEFPLFIYHVHLMHGFGIRIHSVRSSYNYGTVRSSYNYGTNAASTWRERICSGNNVRIRCIYITKSLVNNVKKWLTTWYKDYPSYMVF